MENNHNFETWFGCVLIVVILGLLGNLLSIISVVYATRKENHGFGPKKWINDAVFVINLVFVDSCACVLVLATLFYATTIYAAKEQFLEINVTKYDQSICKFLILGIQNLAQITGWSVALILFWRAFGRYR